MDKLIRNKFFLPIIVLLLVLSAWHFRWDIKTTGTDKDLKIIYKSDRWTGDRWIEVYGRSGGTLYAGTELPVAPDGERAYGKQADKIETKRNVMDKVGYAAILACFAWIAVVARKEIKERKGEVDKEVYKKYKLKREADLLNDQAMLEFFQELIDEYGIASTAQETYDKTFKGKSRSRNQQIMKSTLQDRYVTWQELEEREGQ